MAQRISRAKQRIKAAGAGFALPPEAERADRLRRRAPRALPDLQRGLHRHVGPRPAARRARPPRRSASPACVHRAAPRRRRGRRAARAHAAHRRAAPGAHRRRRRAGPARRAGPQRCWNRADDRRGRRRSITDALADAPARPLPAAGRDRRRPRRGADAPRTPTGRRSSPSTTCSPGPSTIATATAWLRVTIGFGRDAREQLVEGEDLRPVGVLRASAPRRGRRRSPPAAGRGRAGARAARR